MGDRAVTSAREALTAELLGDAALLLEKADGLKGEITAAGEAASREIGQAADRAAATIAEAARVAASAVAKERATWSDEARTVNREIKAAALTVTGSARRLALGVLGLGFVAGIGGGLLAGFALAGHMLK